MEIFVNVKSLGKKKKALTPIAYQISDSMASLRELLSELVRIEVERYNEKSNSTDDDEGSAEIRNVLLMSSEKIESQADAGKVGFGRLHTQKRPELEKATANALQCYEDGLIRVFQNEKELHGSDELLISPGDTFTLIRLTFLTGRLW